MGQGGSIKQQHKQVDPEVTFTETSAGFGSGGEQSRYKILQEWRVCFLFFIYLKFLLHPAHESVSS